MRTPIVVLGTATLLSFAGAWLTAEPRDRYGDRDLVVAGTSGGVDTELTGHPLLILDTPDQFAPTFAEMAAGEDARAPRLSAGRRVQLRCGDSDVVRIVVVMKDCVFGNQVTTEVNPSSIVSEP